ncbi:hypothetical protein Bbelb_443060 [Branchiostoma belcheri]|nr:hypothetical protein Bbelb_443060 [Branchiostoma belcheri]
MDGTTTVGITLDVNHPFLYHSSSRDSRASDGDQSYKRAAACEGHAEKRGRPALLQGKLQSWASLLSVYHSFTSQSFPPSKAPQKHSRQPEISRKSIVSLSSMDGVNLGLIYASCNQDLISDKPLSKPLAAVCGGALLGTASRPH